MTGVDSEMQVSLFLARRDVHGKEAGSFTASDVRRDESALGNTSSIFTGVKRDKCSLGKAACFCAPKSCVTEAHSEKASLISVDVWRDRWTLGKAGFARPLSSVTKVHSKKQVSFFPKSTVTNVHSEIQVSLSCMRAGVTAVHSETWTRVPAH